MDTSDSFVSKGRLYQIKDWDAKFEHHKSKILKTVRFVQMSNSLDGLDFIRLMNHPNGVAHYGVWSLLILIASRCETQDNPRGRFSHNGIPLTLEDISLMSRVPMPILKEAMERFVNELQWIQVDGAIRRGSAGETPDPGANPALIRREMDDVSKEVSKGSKEVSNSPAAPPAPLEMELLKPSIEDEIAKTAQVLRERHPKIRTCGQKVVERQLKAILKATPSKERFAKLQQIDAVHLSHCESWEWKKDGGQWAKSLENWLAPTQGRYLEPAPPGSDSPPNGSHMEIIGGKINDSTLRASQMAWGLEWWKK